MKKIIRDVCILLFLIFAAVVLFPKINFQKNIIGASKGNIDLKEKNLKKAIKLDGEWQIIWNELVEPKDFNENKELKYISLPTDLSKNLKNGQGVATLKLNVNGLKSNEIYALSIPYFSSSNKVWVDGKIITETGKVSENKQLYKAEYMPKEISFQARNNQVEIVIQVANFHHRRDRLLSIKFGEVDGVYSSVNMKIMKQSLIIGSLLLIAVYYLILYKIQNNEKAMLYLALIAIVVAIREMIVHERILMRLFPNFSPEWMMKLGYLPVFIVMPLIAFYIQYVFQVKELKKFVDRLGQFAVVITGVIIITNVKVYDLLFQYGSFVILIIAAYLIYVIASKHLIKKTKRAETMAIGSAAVLIGAVNDVFRELGIINTPELLSAGVVVFILFQAIFLAWRYNDSFEQVVLLSEENEAMYEELQELNIELEQKVKLRTKELEKVNAELSKLSIKDPLTSIGNRRYCDDSLRKCWEDSITKNIKVGLIMIDIDYFKKYNDCYGHLQGDCCLKLISKKFKEVVTNEKWSVTRYGGEEFLIILPEADLKTTENIAKQIKMGIKSLEIEHKKSDVSNSVTLSMGVGVFKSKGFKDEKEWLNKVDELLYKAKSEGRNKFEVGEFCI